MYLRNDADLKPFLHSRGKCIPGAGCQAPSVLPWTCWAKSGALHKPDTLENAAGMKHLQSPGEEELAQSCPGSRALSSHRITDGAASAQLLEAERQEKDGLNRISFLLQLDSGLIAISRETSLRCGGSFCSFNESRLCLILKVWSRTLLSTDNRVAQKIVSEGCFEKKKVDEVRQIQSYIWECIGWWVKDWKKKNPTMLEGLWAREHVIIQIPKAGLCWICSGFEQYSCFPKMKVWNSRIRLQDNQISSISKFEMVGKAVGSDHLLVCGCWVRLKGFVNDGVVFQSVTGISLVSCPPHSAVRGKRGHLLQCQPRWSDHHGAAGPDQLPGAAQDLCFRGISELPRGFRCLDLLGDLLPVFPHDWEWSFGSPGSW